MLGMVITSSFLLKKLWSLEIIYPRLTLSLKLS